MAYIADGSDNYTAQELQGQVRYEDYNQRVHAAFGFSSLILLDGMSGLARLQAEDRTLHFRMFLQV